MKDHNIISVVAQAKGGDKQAFATLYETVYHEMYRYALFSLKNSHDAEDCVAEAVYDAFQTISKLRDDAAYKAWIFRILSAKIKRKLKSYTTRSSVQIEDVVMRFDMPDLDLGVDLAKALLSLDDANRMIVTLAVIQNYNSDEIAQIMSINRSTVRSKLSRSLKKLREVLQDFEG